jgi:tetratricopeptide (TPR) repeat protein
VTEALLQEIRTLKSVFESARDPEGRAFAPLADAYRRAGEVQQAVRVLNSGLARHPNFVPGHVVAARLYVEQGLSEEAQIAARNALDLDADNVSALRSLLRVLEERGEAEAEDVRSRLLALEPDFVPEEPAPPPPPRRSRVAVPPPLPDVAPEPVAYGEAPSALEEESVVEAAAPMEAIDLESMAFDIESLSSGAGGAYALDPEEATEREDAAPTLVSGFGATGEEPMIDLEGLASVSEAEVEEEVSLTALGLEPETELPTEEPVIDLESLAPVAEDADEEIVALAELAPEVEMELPEEEPVVDLADLAPLEAEEPVMELADLAPEAEEPVMELAELAPEAEEPVMELADLAPEAEEPVMELADLAPEAEEPVMELADLAPEAEEPVMELADLAPEAEEPVIDLADLAPEVEETVIELEVLAPEGTVMDFSDLAPEPEEPEPEPEIEPEPAKPAEITMLDLVEMTAEEEVVIDLDALGPGPSAEEPEAEEEEEAPAPVEADESESATPQSEGEEDEGVGEPVYTRTLAELYVKQGAFDEALKVYRHLAELSPGDDRIAQRIEELGSGLLPEEDEHADGAEATTRELGDEGGHEVEVEIEREIEPGATGAEASPSSIQDYFEGLLNWKPGKHS